MNLYEQYDDNQYRAVLKNKIISYRNSEQSNEPHILFTNKIHILICSRELYKINF